MPLQTGTKFGPYEIQAPDVGEQAASLQLGIAQPLFQAHVLPIASMYDVARDGRFLVNSVGEDKSVTPLTLVVNWTAELKKK